MKMKDFNKISKQAADVAERVADVADAARGEGPRKDSGGGGGRWLLLPAAAAAAAIYAVRKSGADVPRRAKELGRQVKERASDMPDLDLLNRVKEVSGLATNGQAAPQGQGEQDRRERAKRRERRRKRTTA